MATGDDPGADPMLPSSTLYHNRNPATSGISARDGAWYAFTVNRSRDDREAFIQEVTGAADKMPTIAVAQTVQGLLALLAVAAGVGLYLLLRRRAPGLGLAGLIILVLWGAFSAVQAMVGAAMVAPPRCT